MNSFCVLTPAIIDKDCISLTAPSIAENIFKNNSSVKFKHIIQLCDHKREGYSGTLDEICEIYKSESTLENCEVLINVSSPRVGHVMAGYNLFCEFLKTGSDYCVVIEEDTKVMHPIDLQDINLVIEKYPKSIVHMSMGYDYPGMNKWKAGDSGKEDCSSEAFLDKKIFETDSTHVFSNYMNFCSWNGTILSREIVKKIVASFLPFSTENCEDQIGNMPFYNNLDVLTLGSGDSVELNGGREDFFKHYDWQLPKENHMLLEILRRGRSECRPGYIG
jgi:hypothetical protein